jgi:hypothetical protein
MRLFRTIGELSDAIARERPVTTNAHARERLSRIVTNSGGTGPVFDAITAEVARLASANPNEAYQPCE